MVVDPISEEEVFERLRADLLTQGLVLRRGNLDEMRDVEPGRYYTTRGETDEVVEAGVDLERQARQRGVLKPNEGLVPTPDPAG